MSRERRPKPVLFPQVNRERFPIEVRHRECKGVAFYRSPGMVLKPEMVCFTSGEQPRRSDQRVVCGNCLQLARTQDLDSFWPGRCLYCGDEVAPQQRHCVPCIAKFLESQVKH